MTDGENFQSGDEVRIKCGGQTIAGTVLLASSNANRSQRSRVD